MKLLENQGPSTASFSDGSQGAEDDNGNEYRNEKSGYEKEDTGMPPSYADSIPTRFGATNASASSSRPAGPRPTNHTAIILSNTKISGHWNVDTNLTVPEALLKPLETGQVERPNLHLHTTNSLIQANVALISGSAQRANLEFDTSNAKVMVTIVSRINAQPFKLKANTKNAEVTIALPFDFIGPLRYRTKNAKVKFSESVQAITSTFSDGSSFVGDWQAAGFVDFAKWEGDEVEVETSNAKIHFIYASDVSREVPKESRSPPSGSGSKLKKGGGFFGRH